MTGRMSALLPMALVTIIFAGAPSANASDGSDEYTPSGESRLRCDCIMMSQDRDKHTDNSYAACGKNDFVADKCSIGLAENISRVSTTDDNMRNVFEKTVAADNHPFSHTQDGSFVSFDGAKLLMIDAQGEEQLIPLADDVSVTCDGKVCTMTQFWTGIMIRVTTRNKVAIRIDAVDRDAVYFVIL
jgi:hypothetical protein